MCLDTIYPDEKIKELPESGYYWKVCRVVQRYRSTIPNRPTRFYYALFWQTVYARGLNIDNSMRAVTMRGGTRYPAGFHLYRRKQDAERRAHPPGLPDRCIVRAVVKRKDIVAFGQEGWGFPADVIVTKQMIMPKRVRKQR